MSKLVQIGYNPGYPVETEKYWRFSLESPPPTWLTDIAKIKEIKDWPILDTERLASGGLAIKGPSGNLVILQDPEDSWVIFDDRLGPLSMTNKQKEFLYEEI